MRGEELFEGHIEWGSHSHKHVLEMPLYKPLPGRRKPEENLFLCILCAFGHAERPPDCLHALPAWRALLGGERKGCAVRRQLGELTGTVKTMEFWEV